LLQVLEAEETPEAQAVLVTGLCKLLLAGMITEPRVSVSAFSSCDRLLKALKTKVLTCLALMYISPTTVDNQELRQCLSYFFPVYSYSSPANQDRMQSVSLALTYNELTLYESLFRKIFIPTFDLAVRMYEDLDDDQEMILPYQFGLLMVDWTNPQKAAEM
jgi:condensin complex subunit 3